MNHNPQISEGVKRTRKTKSKRTRRITVEDTFTGELTHLYTLRALVSFCGDPKLSGQGILSHYRNKLFKRRYRFSVDSVKEPPVIIRPIEYYDYVKHHRIIFASVEEVQSITGNPVKRIKLQLLQPQLVLWYGVVVKYIDDPRQFPRYDLEDIEESFKITIA